MVLFILFVLFLLTSCTVGPNYSAPDMSLSPTFIEASNTDTSIVGLTHTPDKWWELLGDEVLSELITTAVDANHDIQVAKARLLESRAGRNVAGANSLPSVSAHGMNTTQYQSKNSPTYGGGARDSDSFRLGFDASWEIDVFGAVRRSVEAAEAREYAAEASLDDVIRTIMAEVALNYVELRGLQQRKAVLIKNISVQQQTFTFTQNRRISGLGTRTARII